ncbi:hypothetical protein SAMN05446635_5754 [Burkholderia sp. OK233]|nr:hypothetical protein SAMN05446635_5754 [Burkholderia sp. OK233]
MHLHRYKANHISEFDDMLEAITGYGVDRSLKGTNVASPTKDATQVLLEIAGSMSRRGKGRLTVNMKGICHVIVTIYQ